MCSAGDGRAGLGEMCRRYAALSAAPSAKIRHAAETEEEEGAEDEQGRKEGAEEPRPMAKTLAHTLSTGHPSPGLLERQRQPRDVARFPAHGLRYQCLAPVCRRCFVLDEEPALAQAQAALVQVGAARELHARAGRGQGESAADSEHDARPGKRSETMKYKQRY